MYFCCAIFSEFVFLFGSDGHLLQLCSVTWFQRFGGGRHVYMMP